ncbi:Protein NipSnap 3A [Chlorella vulgaris]
MLRGALSLNSISPVRTPITAMLRAMASSRITQTLGRCFSAAAGAASHTGLLELRQYTMQPQGIKEFLRLTQDSVELRKSLLPFLGMFTCDTGGALNRAVHLYHYRDFDHRDLHRAASAASSEWQNGYLAHSRTCLAHQESSIFVPAAGVMAAAGAAPVQSFEAQPLQQGKQAVYELRQYQLKPGYDGVPKLVAAFERGIPHKVAADTQGKLVFFGHTEVGMLNSVIELWRYPSAQACHDARKASRAVPEWRECIAAVTPGVAILAASGLQMFPLAEQTGRSLLQSNECLSRGLQGTCNGCTCCCYSGGAGIVTYEPSDTCTCVKKVDSSQIWATVVLSVILVLGGLMVSLYFGGSLPISPYPRQEDQQLLQHGSRRITPVTSPQLQPLASATAPPPAYVQPSPRPNAMALKLALVTRRRVDFASMPPRTPTAKPKTPAGHGAAPADDDVLAHELEAREAALATAADRLGRLASSQAALDCERGALSSRLRDERTQFGEINGHLKRELETAVRRAEGLEARLADAHAQLRGASAASDERARGLEAQHAAAQAAWLAHGEEQRQRQGQADAFLQERDALNARIELLTSQLEDQGQQSQQQHLDLERQHAGEREQWRRDMQLAVQSAPELQYQGRYVQGLLSSNAELQHEAEQLRLALDISRSSEQELIRKALAGEKAADSLLARLVAVEQQRVAGEAELSEAQEQVQRAQEESFAMMRRSQEHHRRIEQLEGSLAAAKQEVKQLKASHSDAANFLLLCLADVRQDMQTAQGRAVQQAGKLAAQQQQQPLVQQQQQQECEGIEEMPCADGSPCAVTAPAAEPSVGHGQPAVLLAELSLQQRQAVLAKLLRTVRGGEWLEGQRQRQEPGGPEKRPAGRCRLRAAVTVKPELTASRHSASRKHRGSFARSQNRAKLRSRHDARLRCALGITMFQRRQRRQQWRWLSGTTRPGRNDGAEHEARSKDQAWETATRVFAETNSIAEGGDLQGAKTVLKQEVAELLEQFGSNGPAMGLLQNQLALWSFYCAEYGDAVAAARAAQQVWVTESGQESTAAVFHGIRLGMALAASGEPVEAFPLLEKGLTLNKLQELEPLIADQEAAPASSSAADEEALAAREQEKQLAVLMLDRLGRALQEAKFYRSLSFFGSSGRELESKWDEKGAGAVFFLQQEMSDAVTDMLRWVPPNHPIVVCALREHKRLVEQCGVIGLRRLQDDLQIHSQRLQDLVNEAATAHDG